MAIGNALMTNSPLKATSKKIANATATTIYQVPEGLVINLIKEILGHSGLTLSVEFVPNHGLDESAEASAQFKLER